MSRGTSCSIELDLFSVHLYAFMCDGGQGPARFGAPNAALPTASHGRDRDGPLREAATRELPERVRGTDRPCSMMGPTCFRSVRPPSPGAGTGKRGSCGKAGRTFP